MMICLSWLVLGGAPCGWVIPFTASFGANVLVSASIHCAATGEVIPDADFSPCSCVSGSAWGWPEAGEDGWFVGTKGTHAGLFG